MDLNKEKNFIYENLDFLNNKNFSPKLIIVNKRTPLTLKKDDIILELVFDQIRYQNTNGKVIEEMQIEIELKSDYSHRVSLKILTDNIENNIEGLIPFKKSKYLRGLELLDLYSEDKK
jgi:hypothetical protein